MFPESGITNSEHLRCLVSIVSESHVDKSLHLMGELAKDIPELPESSMSSKECATLEEVLLLEEDWENERNEGRSSPVHCDPTPELDRTEFGDTDLQLSTTTEQQEIPNDAVFAPMETTPEATAHVPAPMPPAHISVDEPPLRDVLRATAHTPPAHISAEEPPLRDVLTHVPETCNAAAYVSAHQFETDVDADKQSLLLDLRRLEMTGHTLSRTFTVQDSVAAMTFEIRKQAILDEEQYTVRNMRDALFIVVSVVQWACVKSGLKSMQGWSAVVQRDAARYDQPLRGMYAKWFRRGRRSTPELDLAFALGSSAAMHCTGGFLGSALGPRASMQGPQFE